MYRPITMYQIVCDRCGEVFGGTDTCSALFSNKEVDIGDYSDWEMIDGKHYCPDCYEVEVIDGVYNVKAKIDMKIGSIKFKAKRLDGKGWVCGYFYEENDNTYIIENRQKESKLNRNITYQVDPSTVCQFTGLIDMNRVEVYENDIVKAVDWEETICNVEYKDYGFCLCSKSFRDGVEPLFVAVGNCDIYVVGNKFEEKVAYENANRIE